MRARLLFCFVAVTLMGVVASPVFAQGEFVKTLGGGETDYGLSVIETSEGGFVVTGRTTSFGPGYGDVLLAKFDSTGNHLWSRALGGDYGVSVIEVSDGGLVVAGIISGIGPGSGNLLLTKFDSSGNYLWTRTLGGIEEFAFSYSVIQVSDRGLIAVGSVVDPIYDDYDLLLAKFDSTRARIFGQGPLEGLSRSLGGR